jgi:hypothetical protein
LSASYRRNGLLKPEISDGGTPLDAALNLLPASALRKGNYCDEGLSPSTASLKMISDTMAHINARARLLLLASPSSQAT